MARSVTLGSMRSQVRQRADMVNSTFVTDAEINQYINNSATELYDLLAQKFGNDYFVSSYDFTTAGNTDTYDLPADFYKLIGVDLVLSGSDWATIRPYQFNERNRYSSALSRSVFNITDLRYRLQGNQIRLLPVPGGASTIRLWYVPILNELVSDADTLDGVNGYEEFVIIDAAIKCMQKEESDVSVLAAQKAGIINRIEAAAENRSVGEGERVSDVRSSENEFWGGYV